MPGPAKPLNVLAPQIEAERQRIRAQFDGGATAKQTLRALCEVADNTIQQIFAAVMKVHESPEDGLALAPRRSVDYRAGSRGAHGWAMDARGAVPNPANEPINIDFRRVVQPASSGRQRLI